MYGVVASASEVLRKCLCSFEIFSACILFPGAFIHFRHGSWYRVSLCAYLMRNKSACLSRTWKSQIGAVHVSEMAIPFFTSLSARQLVNWKISIPNICAAWSAGKLIFFPFAFTQWELIGSNWTRRKTSTWRRLCICKVSKVQHSVLTHSSASCKIITNEYSSSIRNTWLETWLLCARSPRVL
jgi:hypothetical protein